MRAGWKKVGQAQTFVTGKLPQFQKHLGQTLHRFPTKQYGGIFPVTVFFLLVDVFVSKVDAASEADISVDDTDFAVIAVVCGGVEPWTERVEDTDLKSLLPQIVGVEGRQGGNTADIIVKDAYLYPVGTLVFQNFEDGVPHLSVLYDEIFQQDKFLCAAKLLQQPCKELFPAGKVFRFSVLVKLKSRYVVDVVCLSGKGIMIFPQPFQRLTVSAALGQGTMVLMQQGVGIAFDLARHPASMHLASEDEIEHAADERNSHNDNDPGNFKGGVILPGEDVQHHQNADDIKDNADPIAHGTDLDQKKQQQKKLDKNQHADDEQSAGEDLEQSLFMGAAGRDLIWLDMGFQEKHLLF